MNRRLGRKQSFYLLTICVLALVGLVSLLPTVASGSGSPTSEPAAPACAPGEYAAEYFANRTLLGTPDFTRCETAPLGYDWGPGGPGSGMPTDGFSARWTGTFSFGGGVYTFTATADDGIRVWVDDQLVLDKWLDQPPTTYQVSVPLVAGSHVVKGEYYENGGGAVARVSWTQACGVGQYRAEYFGNRSLLGAPAIKRCESAPLSYDWMTGGPGTGVGVDSFSARWQGVFSFPEGTYSFTATSDDGARVWVDGRLIVDAWRDQPPTSYEGRLALAEGHHVVRVEYYERTGGAVVRLQWQMVCPVGQYRAEYFNNRTLSGQPALSRCEQAPLGYDWQSGGPAAQVNADGFSARWIGDFDFAAGPHTFRATADDGARVWVDNEPLIDRWIDQSPTTYHAWRSMSAGTHSVRVEYYENLGGAVVGLDWTPGCPKGLFRADYFNNTTLAGSPVLSRCESAPIKHDWGSGGPGSGVSADRFSVRWTGTFDFSAARYAFWVTGDDGVRLWLDGQLLVDKWLLQAPTEYGATPTVAEGEHEVKLEYYENLGGAVAKLEWIRGADVGLDPGHDNVTLGAVGGGLYEYKVTFDLATRVRAILQAAGYSVNLSRQDDNPLTDRTWGTSEETAPTEMAARFRAVGPVRAYVPIHLNGSADTSQRGTETYYNVDNNPNGLSYRLATELQTSQVYRIRQAGYQTLDRGVKSDLLAGRAFGHFPSLRGPYPSALTESLFLSNSTEATLLSKSYIRQAIAQGIADGIIAYLQYP